MQMPWKEYNHLLTTICSPLELSSSDDVTAVTESLYTENRNENYVGKYQKCLESEMPPSLGSRSKSKQIR